ncbi:MAG: polysaccharide deacetylase family protein [Clostridiales bacterium]|nr:polysaccharide deacetylase family protein [Clostridiales bacterium]
MKKIIISLICVGIFLLCGCTSSSTNENDSSTSSADNTDTSDGTNVAETTVVADAVSSSEYSTEKVVWGPGYADDHERPTDPVNLQEQYGELGAQFIMNDDKFVCLTFDEGYENGYTPAILDTLKEKNVKAVFFVTYDFAKDNPDLIQRMIDEGHVVGNHTYRHYTMDEVTTEEATEEITVLHDYIKENFDYTMTLFRFPKGEFSESTLALANSLGYKSVFWSFAYADWDTQNPPDADEALQNITEHTHNGEILLLHAVSQTNAELMPQIIDSIREQGYEFTVEV